MQHILSLSYGKDSCACLGAIEQLGWPLDRIITAEVWATDTISADLPPMVEFKEKADKIIKERYGIEVEHICATDKNNNKISYDYKFHTIRTSKRKHSGSFEGWPFTVKGAWCNSLKTRPIRSSLKLADNYIQYLGIASDEVKRIERHTHEGVKLPLVEVGWTEAMCRDWCEEHDLLSPIYTTVSRGGCWFCHNQPTDQLRKLRHDYPEYWELMLKWDNDSPVTFHPDGHTVHDYDKRFAAEDNGEVPTDRRFRWKMIGR